MKLGKAKYGGQKKAYFKLKEGKSTFRILPPMGDLADEGVWSLYYRVNYGYVNSADKSRPFESSLVKGNKGMVEIPDAAVERFDKLKARYEEAKKAGDKKSEELLGKLVGTQKARYNVDSNHYMNAIDTQGNIGVLKLRHTAKKALDVVIRELRDKNVDPLSEDNGRYFTFTRTGMGRETTFAVSVHKQTMLIDGVGEVERDVVHKLDADIVARFKNEAAELQKLFKKPTAEQIAQIVAESNLQTGVSPNIDKILGYKEEETAGDGEAEESQEAAEVAVAQQVLKAEPEYAPKVSTKAETTTQSVTPTAEVTTKVETKPATAAPTTAKKIADMSEDEFMSSLGISK